MTTATGMIIKRDTWLTHSLTHSSACTTINNFARPQKLTRWLTLTQRKVLMIQRSAGRRFQFHNTADRWTTTSAKHWGEIVNFSPSSKFDWHFRQLDQNLTDWMSYLFKCSSSCCCSLLLFGAIIFHYCQKVWSNRNGTGGRAGRHKREFCFISFPFFKLSRREIINFDRWAPSDFGEIEFEFCSYSVSLNLRVPARVLWLCELLALIKLKTLSISLSLSLYLAAESMIVNTQNLIGTKL